MARPDRGMGRQLRRQSIWLRDSLQWILREKVLDGRGRSTALDVGCGPGFVMELMGDQADVRGVDIDADMVRACRARGLLADEGSVYDLPFRDESFDIVYCTFLFLWLEDPSSALAEMTRVSRRHVLCLAEPDFGARIDYPEALGGRVVCDRVVLHSYLSRHKESYSAGVIRDDIIFPYAGRNFSVYSTSYKSSALRDVEAIDGYTDLISVGTNAPSLTLRVECAGIGNGIRYQPIGGSETATQGK